MAKPTSCISCLHEVHHSGCRVVMGYIRFGISLSCACEHRYKSPPLIRHPDLERMIIAQEAKRKQIEGDRENGRAQNLPIEDEFDDFVE